MRSGGTPPAAVSSPPQEEANAALFEVLWPTLPEKPLEGQKAHPKKGKVMQ